jgi:transcriptional regulator PpsR
MSRSGKSSTAKTDNLSEVTSPAMSSILTAASDIALVLDRAGVIRDITLGPSDQPLDESRAWVGHDWIDTVTPESRTKITDMLAEVAAQGISRRRQVNHLSPSGADIPIVYTAVRMEGTPGKVVAIGRDLRAVSALQQRLVEAQQSLERDYWRMRHIETRYRLLFQVSSEAVLMIDAGTQKVIEANPAAAQLFDQPVKRLVGRTFPFDIDTASEAAIAEQLATVRSHGRVDDLVVRLAAAGRSVTLSLSLVRQDTTTLFLVRLIPVVDQSGPHAGPASAGAAFKLLESLPDGFVIGDADGRILMANRAFLAMVELPTLEQARGRLLSQWVGRPGADLGRLLAMLREHGVVRLFGTSLRGDLGSSSEVEISSVALSDSAEVQLGFLIRDVGRRLVPSPRGARDLSQAVEQLTSLVGRVSLKHLVRDTTDLVERHFIEAALETTDDNRTSAAEVLGVSRQSLYMKLKRYGLGADVDASVEGSSTRGRKITPKG